MTTFGQQALKGSMWTTAEVNHGKKVREVFFMSSSDLLGSTLPSAHFGHVTPGRYDPIVSVEPIEMRKALTSLTSDFFSLLSSATLPNGQHRMVTSVGSQICHF